MRFELDLTYSEWNKHGGLIFSKDGNYANPKQICVDPYSNDYTAGYRILFADYSDAEAFCDLTGITAFRIKHHKN